MARPTQNQGRKWKNNKARRKHRAKLNDTYKYNRRKPTPLGKWNDGVEATDDTN